MRSSSLPVSSTIRVKGLQSLIVFRLDVSIAATSCSVSQLSIIMGNTCSCLRYSCQKQNENLTDNMPDVQGMQHVEDLIVYMDQLMNKINRGCQEQLCKPISVASSIDSGGNMIEKLSKRLKWHPAKKCLLSTLDRETSKVVSDLLHQGQQIQFVGMALSITAHLLERAEQTSNNKEKCLYLLHYTAALAKHMKNLDIHVERRKLEDILRFIVKATLICALQMEASSLCRFISAALDDADLQNLESQLVHSYQDLQLQTLTAVLDRLPIDPGPSQGLYPQYAVGIDEAQNKVIELLDLKDSAHRVVVIYGVGGIGKTTLATAVFNRLNLSGYHHCRVVMNQDSKESNILRMQAQILRDLFKINLKLNNCIEGQEKLAEAFRKASKPAFLFIDNALRRTDLEMLLPIKHLSGHHMLSRILVTTRNLKQTDIFGHLDGIQVYSHRVGSLSQPQAKRLLSHYALGDANRNFDPDINIDVLLQICGGIPLVLIIAGSELRSRENTMSACNEILQGMENLTGLEGGEDLSERIVDFVYRQLREPSKDAFLDVAFFFYDWKRSKVAYIVGETQLRDLEGAALVTTSEEDKVNIHDVVKARARKLSEGNRITDWESLVDLLGDEQKLKQTKGIWLRNDDDYISIEAKHVDCMSRSLRVFSLGRRMRLHGLCERAFEELRFLHISSEDMLPIQLRKSERLGFLIVHFIKGQRTSKAEFTINLPQSPRLLYLELDASYPPALLHINGHFISLKELRLSNITLENFEISISQLKSLHSLLLLRCGGFTSIPESLENFSSLKILNLKYCSKLQRLPESFGNLCCMLDLHMDCCSMLERLPESFGNLSSLRDLNMSKCFMLERLPESFGNLSSLQTLGINECSKLKTLPESFGNLSSLQRLYMFDCSKLERLPENFGNLSSIRDLHMSYCFKLERLPDSFGNLSSMLDLDMRFCSKLERLPESFGNLSSMRDLNMSYCSKLERLPQSFGNLFFMRDLDMDVCSELERLPDSFGNLSSLQHLRMSCCLKLERLPQSFGNLCSMRDLDLSDCSKLERLPASFGNLSSMRNLNMSNCSMLERLPQTFDQLRCLQILKMDGCEKICSLSQNFGQLKCLKFLNISNCKELKRFPDDLVCLTSLAAVKAYGCAELEEKAVESLVEIRNLIFLEMGESPMLIERWKQIQQHRPLIGAALRFEGGSYPYGEIMSTMFSHGSRFLHVDDGQLAEVASSSFLGVKVGLLLTACALSDELKRKLLEVASLEFQIIYVDVNVEGEAEGSGWMEERDKRIRKTLAQLPEGSCAWTSPFQKTSRLFAYSIWEFTGRVDTSIVGTSVVVDEEGRRNLSHPLEMIFGTCAWDCCGVDMRSLFSPVWKAWEWMRYN